MCDEVQVADIKAQRINLHHEALSILQTEEKIELTLTASNESADVTDLDNSYLSRRNEVDDFEMESRKMEMERNGIPAVIDKDDTDDIDGLLCSDNILKDPNT